MIKEFTDLEAWKKSHELVLLIYKLTKKLPTSEDFGLISQMQQASISVTSNIAEGFGRYTYKEKMRFYYMSSGSLSELKNQLIICKDLGYLTVDEFLMAQSLSDASHKLLKGLINASRRLVDK